MTPALERVALRLKAEPTLMNKRAQSVEPAFGTLKRWLNSGRLLSRGRSKVKTEFGLGILHGTATIHEAVARGPRHGPTGRSTPAGSSAAAGQAGEMSYRIANVGFRTV